MPNTTPRPRAGKLAALTLSAAMMSTGLVALGPSAALATPEGGYADLVETVSPSVVYIEVETSAKPANLPDNFPFEQFQRRHGQVPGMPGMGEIPQSQPRQGLGSGFIISESGEIVTNNHVVQGADKVTVKLADGRSFTAKVVGTDKLTDLALLRVEAGEKLPAIDFGASSSLRAGDEVFAVGNPFGLGGTVTSGIVSATSRNINSGPYDDFIQTDAAINQGNSGGPLFNSEGKVVGVNTAIYSPDGGSVGIGFAVPSDMVQRVIADLRDDGSVDRGWLGVQIRPMTPEVAAVLGLDGPKGAVIENLDPNGPAAKSGLKAGDIVLSFAGTEIGELRDLTRAVADAAQKSTQDVVVLRKGAEQTIQVELGNMDASDA